MLSALDLEVESGLHWLQLLVTPALVFWAGGAAILVTESPGGFRGLEAWLAVRPSFVIGAIAIGAVLLVLVSGLFASRITDPILRMLEGYWGGWFSTFRQFLVRRLEAKAEDEERWQALQGRFDRFTDEEAREFTALDTRLRRIPPAGRGMPTRLGNALASSEAWPSTKYGLDPAICWPRLWLVLPENARKAAAESRGSLDGATAAMWWAAAFIVWTPWALWAAPSAVLVSVLLYRYWVLHAAQRFGDTLEACFDVHHHLLYAALGWSVPTTASAERAAGKQLTQYLWRGEADDLVGSAGDSGATSQNARRQRLGTRSGVRTQASSK